MRKADAALAESKRATYGKYYAQRRKAGDAYWESIRRATGKRKRMVRKTRYENHDK